MLNNLESTPSGQIEQLNNLGIKTYNDSDSSKHFELTVAVTV